MSKKSDPKLTRAMLILLPLARAFTARGEDIEALLVRNRVAGDLGRGQPCCKPGRFPFPGRHGGLEAS